MGKSILFIILSAWLVIGSEHCPAQGVQNIRLPSRKLSSPSDFTSPAGSGAVAANNKELHGKQAGTLPVSSDDTVKIIGGGTRMLTKPEFLQRIWDYEKTPQQWVFLGEKPAIIDFYADWCGPCKTAAPILEEVSYEFAGQIDVYKIDTQKEQELAAVFAIQSIPAFLYIPKSGKPAMAMGIARSKEDTRQMFVDNIKKLLLQGK